MVTIVVPLYNVMAVIVLEYYRGCRPKLVPLLKKIFTNPLILGALAGGAFTMLGVRIPSVLEAPIHQLSALTTPLALFVLGGTLQFSSIREHLSSLRPHWYASCWCSRRLLCGCPGCWACSR